MQSPIGDVSVAFDFTTVEVLKKRKTGHSL